jgi:hypothetical protein
MSVLFLRLCYFAKFVSIRKEAIHTVPYAFYSMLWRSCFQENLGIIRTEICGKGQGQKSAKNCHLTCCTEAQEGQRNSKHCTYPSSVQARLGLESDIIFFSFWAYKLRFSAKLPPIVKRELKIIKKEYSMILCSNTFSH